MFENGKGNKVFYIHEVCDSDGNFVYFESENASETKKSASVSRQLNYGADADLRGISSKDNVPQHSNTVKKNSVKLSDRESAFDVHKQWDEEAKAMEVSHRYDLRQQQKEIITEYEQKLNAQKVSWFAEGYLHYVQNGLSEFVQ